MSIGAVFTGYLNCVKSIARFKTNTLQANLLALMACAVPVGVMGGAYSLYGRVNKQEPSSEKPLSDGLQQSAEKPRSDGLEQYEDLMQKARERFKDDPQIHRYASGDDKKREL